MLSTTQSVTTPSDLSAVLLIMGEGLALVAAVSLMAAGFERNELAGLKLDFTRAALITALISAVLLVFGTIEALGVRDPLVTGFAFFALALAIIAIVTALLVSRFVRRQVCGQENAGDKAPQSTKEGQDRTNVAEPSQETRENDQ